MAAEDTPIHILYLEDDIVDTEHVRRQLKQTNLPIKLHVAKDGVEALDMLHGRNRKDKLLQLPNIILIDINLPRMNGVEFLQKLRSDPELKFIPAYILTTAYTTKDKIATQGLNVAGYIVKPLQYDDIMKIYCSILGASSA